MKTDLGGVGRGGRPTEKAWRGPLPTSTSVPSCANDIPLFIVANVTFELGSCGAGWKPAADCQSALGGNHPKIKKFPPRRFSHLHPFRSPNASARLLP